MSFDFEVCPIIYGTFPNILGCKTAPTIERKVLRKSPVTADLSVVGGKIVQCDAPCTRTQIGQCRAVLVQEAVGLLGKPLCGSNSL